MKQNELVTLIASLCGAAKGDGMNITMVLNNNPDWHLDKGVVSYYVVDGANKVSFINGDSLPFPPNIY